MQVTTLVIRWVLALFALVTVATVRISYAQTPIECSTIVTVQPGDTLSLIAARYNGSQGNYQAIVAATNARAALDNSFTAIANPNVLSVGWKLCIPAGGAAVVSAPANPQNRLPPTATPASAVAPAAVPTPLIWLEPPTLDLELEEMHPLMVEYMRQQEYPGSTTGNRGVRRTGRKIHCHRGVPSGQCDALHGPPRYDYDVAPPICRTRMIIHPAATPPPVLPAPNGRWPG